MRAHKKTTEAKFQYQEQLKEVLVLDRQVNNNDSRDKVTYAKKKEEQILLHELIFIK